jgi:hypothetical protein
MARYITNAGERIVGIAARKLNDEKRWQEIRELNEYRYPGMVGTDYYPPGTLIIMPGKET